MGRPRIRPLAVATAALLLLGPLVMLEVGVRLLIESDRLPEATSSQELTDVGLANLARSGSPDILVLGNSAIRNGLQPDVLETLIAEAGGGVVRVQGIAQGAMSLEAQQLLVRALAERGLLPSTVLVGLTAGTLNGSLDDAEGQAEDWFTASELGQLWSDCAAVSWPEASDCRLGEVSALWRWRGRPDRLVSAALRAMPTTFDHDGRVLQENGWASEEPATARRLREQLPGTLERLPPLGEVPAAVEERFSALVDELRARGVHVVAFALPYSPPLTEALQAGDPGWQERLLDGYADLEASADLDISVVEAFGSWWQPASQHDLRHLSREGAAPATRQLWEVPGFRDAVLAGVVSER
jgi:hypothetical protein